MIGFNNECDCTCDRCLGIEWPAPSSSLDSLTPEKLKENADTGGKMYFSLRGIVIETIKDNWITK